MRTSLALVELAGQPKRDAEFGQQLETEGLRRTAAAMSRARRRFTAALESPRARARAPARPEPFSCLGAEPPDGPVHRPGSAPVT